MRGGREAEKKAGVWGSKVDTGTTQQSPGGGL